MHSTVSTREQNRVAAPAQIRCSDIVSDTQHPGRYCVSCSQCCSHAEHCHNKRCSCLNLRECVSPCPKSTSQVSSLTGQHVLGCISLFYTKCWGTSSMLMSLTVQLALKERTQDEQHPKLICRHKIRLLFTYEDDQNNPLEGLCNNAFLNV